MGGRAMLVPLLVLLLLHAWAAGTSVTLYPNFAEIAAPVRLERGVYVWQPTGAVAGNRIQDLVWMTGVEVKRRVWRNGTLWIFAEGERGVLHHLTRGLSARVGYRLALDRGRLVAWLRVKNALDRPLGVDRLRFVSGDVPLFGEWAAAAADGKGLARQVAPPVFAGSAAGVFRYRLEGPLTLEPELTELPLFTLEVEPRFYWRYTGRFHREQRLPFTRGYAFTAPKPLAAGLVDLFSGGDFVGRVRMPDTYAGERVRLELGPATRARSERRVEVLAETRALRRYRVTTTVTNPGEEPVTVEIVETFRADAVELELPEGARVPDGYRIVFDLAPGESRTYRYQVTLRFRQD